MMFARRALDETKTTEGDGVVSGTPRQLVLTNGEKIAFATLLVAVFGGMATIWGELKAINAATDQRIAAVERELANMQNFESRLSVVESNTEVTKNAILRLEDRLIGPPKGDGQ